MIPFSGWILKDRRYLGTLLIIDKVCSTNGRMILKRSNLQSCNHTLNTFLKVAEMTEENKIFMGIDVSKATLDISINKKHYKINNTDEAITDFIKSVIASNKIKLCVLESTGGYERLVMKKLQQKGIAVHRAHPNKVHAFAKACNHFAKTDKLDALLLEKYAIFVSNKEKGDAILSDLQQELQSLRLVEKSLEEGLHANQCRVKTCTGKSRKYLDKQIEFIKAQLKAIRDDINKLIKEDEDLSSKSKLLMSYKGVGEKIANTLLTDAPELGTLSNKEIASLVGVAPKTNQSGQKTKVAKISGGRFFVRKSLYMAALVAMRHNSKMKQLYERLIASGKKAKVALVAVMRKIIICLNSMVKHNKIYQI